MRMGFILEICIYRLRTGRLVLAGQRPSASPATTTLPLIGLNQ